MRLLLLVFLLLLSLATEVLTGPTGLPSGAILGLRLKRALLALWVGGALAPAGAALQGVLQNPLADPYVLGVSSGAALGYALGVVFGFPPSLGSLLALLGAFGALGLVWALVGRRVYPWTLILAGVMVGFGASALVALIMAVGKEGALKTFFVLWGNLSTPISWGWLWAGVALSAGGLAYLLARSRALDALALGDDEASALGFQPTKERLGVFLSVGILTALTTAAVGAVGFVGLVVPHVARGLGFRKHLALLPASALGGASLVLLADAGLRALSLWELPVGVVTSLLGVPLFLWLLFGRKHQNTSP